MEHAAFGSLELQRELLARYADDAHAWAMEQAELLNRPTAWPEP